MHQSDVASALRVNPGSMSEYLTGKTRMPEHVFLDLCALLRLDKAEAGTAWLMHSLLHVPSNVRLYVEALESERVTRDLCDERLARLRDLTVGMLADRAAASTWKPVLVRADEDTSRIGRAVRAKRDDDTDDPPSEPGPVA